MVDECLIEFHFACHLNAIKTALILISFLEEPFLVIS